MSTPDTETTFSPAAAAKLRASGIDPDRAGALGIRPVADEGDLPDEFRGNPRATVPGMVIDWPTADGDTVPQYRPDDPPELADRDGEPRAVKYLFPTDSYVGVSRVGDWPAEPSTVLVVEGTLQSRSAAQWVERDVAVLATPGCWGWSHDRLPAAELSVVRGADVRVVLDADAATNRQVFDAGTRLAETLLTKGAASVVFPRLGLSRDQGLDDLLGACADDADRRATMAAVAAAEGGRHRDKPADRMPKPRKADRGALGAPDDAGLLAPNDTVLATTWADTARARWRFLLDTERWLRYRIGRWEPVSARAPYDDVARFLVGVAGSYQAAAAAGGDDDLADTANLLLSHNKITTVLARAGGHSDLHVDRTELDSHATLWVAGNGTVDLFSREFRDHDPELLLTVGSDVVYDPGATCPRFDAFLDEILPDPEVRAYVLRLFGVAMLGEVRADAQVFAVFVGSGRNGKGALIRTMERLFGEMAVTIDPRALQEAKFEAHTQEIAKLNGRRLATAQEPEAGKGWNTGRIKSWTGGDRLTGRLMRENDVTFDPSHTLIVTANERPPVARADSAFWMRYREIPFDVSVEGHEDPTLERHIAEHELSGVLNRVLGGLADYLTRGLAEPAAVLAATGEAQAESDHLAVFADTHLARTGDDEDRLLALDVFEACRKWWSQNVTNGKMPADRGRSNFTSQLQRVLGIDPRLENPRKTKVDGSVRLYWHGVRWLNGGGPEEVAEFSPLPVPGNGNRPENPVPGEPGTSDGLPTSPVRVAGIETDSATQLIDVSPGSSVEVAEVAEVADINRGNPITENALPGIRHADDTPRGDTHSAGPWEEKREIGNLGNRTPLPEPSRGPVVIDLETGSADRQHDVADPRGYVRIAGVRTGGTTSVRTGPAVAVELALSSQRVITHNGVAFDLPVLSRADDRVDVLALARAGRLHDTMITESVLHPVLNEAGRPGEIDRAMKWFRLHAVAERRGIPGKVDEIARLAEVHGGYDAIPTDDPEYRAYCAGDVDTTTAVARAQLAEIAALSPERRAYVAREHRVHAVAATMGTTGFAVDADLLQRRFWATYGRKNDLSRRLIADYDLPTVKADGKPSASPAATKGGKAAILRALHGLGVNVADVPRTPKGAPSFGGDAMRELAETYAGHANAEAIAALAEVVADSAGVRTVYGTALEHTHPDGRVHPSVATFQASGRWSVRRPGLTVFGKRGGKVIERAVFTATDPDHALFAIDLSQIDARSIAVHSQDHAYLELFEPGRDAHEIMARLVWGDRAYDADPTTLRERVKAVTHGLPYGLGLTKLVATTGVPEADAQRVIDTRRERFPRMIEWENEVRATGENTGWLDNGFGRMLRVDQRRAYTQSVALMGQSTARDLMMECLLRLPDDVAAMLVAQVHDEAVFEIPRAHAAEIVAVVTEAFNFQWAPPGASRPVRIEAEAGRLAHRWSGCYSAEYERTELG